MSLDSLIKKPFEELIYIIIKSLINCNVRQRKRKEI